MSDSEEQAKRLAQLVPKELELLESACWSDSGFGRYPTDFWDQLARVDPQAPGELHKRLEPRRALPRLDVVNRRAVEAASVGQLFLR
jgi:hypothetical protein